MKKHQPLVLGAFVMLFLLAALSTLACALFGALGVVTLRPATLGYVGCGLVALVSGLGLLELATAARGDPPAKP